jgi:hypothetical protein
VAIVKNNGHKQYHHLVPNMIILKVFCDKNMKKTPKPHSFQQETLIEPPVVIDLTKLLTESKLSENEQGLIKRRLIESRKPFGKVL